MTIPRTSCPNCGHPVAWHGETGENQCKRRDAEGHRCPCQRDMPAAAEARCLEFDEVVLNGMTCSIDRGRHIHTPLLTERPRGKPSDLARQIAELAEVMTDADCSSAEYPFTDESRARAVFAAGYRRVAPTETPE